MKDRLGPDALKEHSVEDLIGVLRLSVSRETLRKILRLGHSPRKKVQEQLLAEV